MDQDLLAVLCCLGGYLLGSIPFGLLLTRLAGLGDIRGIGSGNIGATNVLRTGHKGLAAGTLILDGLKGAAAVLLARALVPEDIVMFAGLAAVLGHLFPVWLNFKGGKGAATGLGVLIAASWPVGLAACAAWLLVVAAARISSLGTLAAFATAPFVGLVVGDFPVVKLAFTIAVLVFVRHQSNIRRLFAGAEPRIGARQATRKDGSGLIRPVRSSMPAASKGRCRHVSLDRPDRSLAPDPHRRCRAGHLSSPARSHYPHTRRRAWMRCQTACPRRAAETNVPTDHAHR